MKTTLVVTIAVHCRRHRCDRPDAGPSGTLGVDDADADGGLAYPDAGR